MMPLEMTTQLAPVFWGMVGLLAVSAVGIMFEALRSREQRVSFGRSESEEEVGNEDLRAAAQ